MHSQQRRTILIQTDKYYAKPVVFKITTCLKDNLIQLDTHGLIIDTLRNTYMKPVSYVSNNAANYN